jgi:formylglycine-generating enzyme required for sulfatase activity
MAKRRSPASSGRERSCRPQAARSPFDPEFFKTSNLSGHNVVCTSGSVERVWRGGSFGFHTKDCRSAYRNGSGPWNRTAGHGFRTAFTLP